MKFWAKTSGKRAELYIYDVIGSGFFEDGITAQSVSDALKDFEPGAELDIFINSPGGQVFEGVSIYNILRRWTGKKRVHIDGIAASIASVIACAGDEIRIAANGMVMIHRPFGMAFGTADKMREIANALDKVHGVILDTYAARTGSDRDKLDEWMTAETWMTADEAVERGFATSKTEEKAIKAEFPLLAKFEHTPEALRREATASAGLIARVNMRADRIRREIPATA